MNEKITQNRASSKVVVATSLKRNLVNYAIIGLVFGGMLFLSIWNGFLFFEWLALGTFIVFALMGIHFIGQNQIKRKV
ncbi:MAG: hypothetical protein AAGF77_14360 [Bacteroidota bacterium]